MIHDQIDRKDGRGIFNYLVEQESLNCQRGIRTDTHTLSTLCIWSHRQCLMWGQDLDCGNFNVGMSKSTTVIRKLCDMSHRY